MMEGAQSGEGEDWLFEGGSRAQVAAAHEPQGAASGPPWLARRKGDTMDLISEEGGVGQVYAFS